MRTRQSVAANPSAQSIAPQPLLRPEFPITDVRCLPFVRDLRGNEARQHGGRRTFWTCNQPADGESYTEQGSLFAAAYLIFLRKNGMMALPLTWILRDMDIKTDPVGIGFLEHLQRYAWSHASLMTAGEIEVYCRHSIDTDRERMAQELVVR